MVSPGNSSGTLDTAIYSTSSYGAVNIASNLTTLNLDAPFASASNATVTGSVTTVNVGAPSGPESGYMVQAGLNVMPAGGTLNLSAGTYLLDGTTGEIRIGANLTLNGNGAVLDGSNGAGPGNGLTRVMEIDGTTAGITVVVNNLTLENGNGAGPGGNDV